MKILIRIRDVQVDLNFRSAYLSKARFLILRLIFSEDIKKKKKKKKKHQRSRPKSFNSLFKSFLFQFIFGKRKNM